MKDWVADLLGFCGVLALGGAMWKAGGEVALLAYVGVVFLAIALVLAWQRSRA